MNEVSDWVAGAASAASAWATVQMYRVSQNTLKLQAAIEASKEPKVHIWFNGQVELTPKVLSSLSIINIGQNSLPIRSLRLITVPGQPMEFQFSRKTDCNESSKSRSGLLGLSILKMSQVASDVILQPHTVYEVIFNIESGQFKCEVTYYDGSQELIDINTSNQGGKYILTGLGGRH